MKKNYTLIIAMVLQVIFNSVLFTQTDNNFKRIFGTKIGRLSENSKLQTYQKIVDRRTVKNAEVRIINNVKLFDNSKLILDLFEKSYPIIKKEEFSFNNGSTWRFENDSGKNFISVVQTKKGITASVWIDGCLYKIEPIADGYHAITEIDISEYATCNMGHDVKSSTLLGKKHSSEINNRAMSTGTPVIKLLFSAMQHPKNILE